MNTKQVYMDVNNEFMEHCPILVELLIPCMKDEINIIHLFNTGN